MLARSRASPSGYSKGQDEENDSSRLTRALPGEMRAAEPLSVERSKFQTLINASRLVYFLRDPLTSARASKPLPESFILAAHARA